MKRWQLLVAAVAITASTAVASAAAAPGESSEGTAIATEQQAFERNVTHGDNGGEPVIAVDPTNEQHVVAIDMSSGMGGVVSGATDGPRCTVWISDDGGDTWDDGNPLPITDPVNQSCEDPHLAAGPDGTMYAGGHAYAGLLLVVNHYRVIRSTDGGHTWSAPVTLAANDKIDSTSTPPVVDDRPFRGWNFVDQSTSTAHPFGVAYQNIPTVTTGGYELYVSTDRGETWNKKPRLGGSDATAAHGVVAKLYTSPTDPSGKPAFWTSTDEGQNWTSAGPVPATGMLRADPSTPGRYAIMQATASSMNIFVTENSGATWSAPVKLSENSDASNTKRFMPWIDYGPTGALGVMWRTNYLDLDPLKGNGTGHGVYDVWAAVSVGGGLDFDTPVRLSSGLSTMPAATNEGWGLWSSPGGDDFSYLAVDHNNVHVVWGDWRTSPDDPSPIMRSMYYGRLTFAP